MNTIEDPIVAEVRANRDAIFASCDYDHAKFTAHTREVEQQLKREGWISADRPVVRIKTQESFIVREEPPASTEL